MDLTLKIWRQKDANANGGIETYKLGGVEPDMSFFEMLDVLNQDLIDKGEEHVVI